MAAAVGPKYYQFPDVGVIKTYLDRDGETGVDLYTSRDHAQGTVVKCAWGMAAYSANQFFANFFAHKRMDSFAVERRVAQLVGFISLNWGEFIPGVEDLFAETLKSCAEASQKDLPSLQQTHAVCEAMATPKSYQFPDAPEIKKYLDGHEKVGLELFTSRDKECGVKNAWGSTVYSVNEFFANFFADKSMEDHAIEREVRLLIGFASLHPLEDVSSLKEMFADALKECARRSQQQLPPLQETRAVCIATAAKECAQQEELLAEEPLASP